MEKKIFKIVVRDQWRQCKEHNMMYIRGVIRGMAVGVAGIKSEDAKHGFIARGDGFHVFKFNVTEQDAIKIQELIEDHYPGLCEFILKDESEKS